MPPIVAHLVLLFVAPLFAGLAVAVGGIFPDDTELKRRNGALLGGALAGGGAVFGAWWFLNCTGVEFGPYSVLVVLIPILIFAASNGKTSFSHFADEALSPADQQWEEWRRSHPKTAELVPTAWEEFRNTMAGSAVALATAAVFGVIIWLAG
jgi:hypothetical protein